MSILYSQWCLLVCLSPESPVSKRVPGTLWTLIHICGLNEWTNEMEKENQKHNWKYFCSCIFCMRLPLPNREPLEDEDSILPVSPQSNHRRLAIFVYLWDLLNVLPQPKLISISYGWTMGSSCVVTHTAHTLWIVELRHCIAACAEPTGSHTGAVLEIYYLRQGCTEILAWRCLRDSLPTIFFNQAILWLRNLQWHPSSSRINAKYWHLRSLTGRLQLIIWDHLLLHPIFSF